MQFEICHQSAAKSRSHAAASKSFQQHGFDKLAAQTGGLTLQFFGIPLLG
jgi:hypothetical protein